MPRFQWKRTDHLVFVGIGTWLLIAYLSVFVDRRAVIDMPWPQALGYSLGLLGFITGFLRYTQPFTFNEGQLERFALALQWVSILLMQLIEVRSLHLIYVIIWASQLPHITSMARSLLATALTLALLIGIDQWQRPDNSWMWEVAMYFLFSSFGILLSVHALEAEKARDKLAEKNAELQATQQLLAANAKEHERLRIARDLHDSMGHHLTSLALQLELASHQQGEALQTTIQKSRHLTKLLLADVRATVSDMRALPSVNIRELLQPIVAVVPRLKLKLDVEHELLCHDAKTAETILRATQEIITNCLKHSDASELTINIRREQENLIIDAIDNGQVKQPVTEGYGLKGLRERVEALSGKLRYGSADNQGFFVHLSLPAS